MLGAGGWAVVAVAGDPLLATLYGPDFDGHAFEFELVMVAAGLAYINNAFEYALTAVQRLRALMFVKAAAVLASLGASVVLVPTHGLAGAAWALTVFYAVPIPLKIWLLSPALGRRPDAP